MATRRDLFEIEDKVPRGTLAYISPDRITANPYQPRKQLNKAALEELKSSIASRGILQALLGVRGTDGKVILIAGHRRWQAAQELGLPRVPVILLNQQGGAIEALLDAVIENVQRENLAPWEEGESYRQLVDEFGWEHRQIASAIGKSRPYVTQRIRAAENIAPTVKEFFLTGDLTVLGFEVTPVTASDISNKSNGLSAEALPFYLRNIELVRRLTALPTEKQVAVLKTYLQEIIAQGEKPSVLALADRLRLSKNGSKTIQPEKLEMPQSDQFRQLELDFDNLEVIQWSRRTKPDLKAAASFNPQELDGLIERYQKDLAALLQLKQASL